MDERMNKAIVGIYGAIAPRKTPATYAGFVELADRGYTFVTVEIPYGVMNFPKIPCLVLVPTDNTMVTESSNPREKPVLVIHHWEPLNELYY